MPNLYVEFISIGSQHNIEKTTILWAKSTFDIFFWKRLLLTMPKKKMAHSSLNASWFALFRLNYRKSVTVRKIFESSLKLDQAEYCEFFCLKMTTKWSWLLCFCLSRSFDHQNFPCFSMYQWKYLSKSKKIHEEKKNLENFLQNGAKQKFVT